MTEALAVIAIGGAIFLGLLVGCYWLAAETFEP